MRAPGLLAFSFILLFFAAMADNSRGELFPYIIHGLGLTDRSASLFFSIPMLASIPATLLAGGALRRWGGLRSAWGTIGTFVSGLIIIGLAPTYPIVLVGGALYGLGMGASHVVQNVIVSQATTPAVRTRYFNFLHVMYGLGSITAPSVALWLKFHLGGWQAVFLALAVAPVLVGLSGRLIRTLPPMRDGAQPLLPFHALLRHPTCRYYGMLMGCYVAAELSVSLWLVLYMTRLGGFSEWVISMFLTGFFVAMTSARVVAGIWLKGLQGEGSRRVLLLVAVSSVAMIFIGLHVHPIGLTLAGGTMGLFFPLGFASLSQEMPDEIEAAMAWVLCVVFIFIAAGQFGVGYLSDHYSIHTAMHVPVVLLAIVAGLLGIRRFPVSGVIASKVKPSL